MSKVANMKPSVDTFQAETVGTFKDKLNSQHHKDHVKW